MRKKAKKTENSYTELWNDVFCAKHRPSVPRIKLPLSGLKITKQESTIRYAHIKHGFLFWSGSFLHIFNYSTSDKEEVLRNGQAGRRSNFARKQNIKLNLMYRNDRAWEQVRGMAINVCPSCNRSYDKCRHKVMCSNGTRGKKESLKFDCTKSRNFLHLTVRLTRGSGVAKMSLSFPPKRREQKPLPLFVSFFPTHSFGRGCFSCERSNDRFFPLNHQQLCECSSFQVFNTSMPW